MAINYYQRSQNVSLAKQAIKLKHLFPNSTSTFYRGFRLIWNGLLQPTPISPIYRVTIIYDLGKSPRVRVISPKLEKHGDKNIPHMYDQKFLCLFRSKYYEWDSLMYISDTIIPWTSLWLFYYEIWHAIGKWRGGGEEPESNELIAEKSYGDKRISSIKRKHRPDETDL